MDSQESVEDEFYGEEGLAPMQDDSLQLASMQDEGLQEVTLSSNVDLIALLNKKDYKGFKEKLNLPMDLEDTDDLHVMVKHMDVKGPGDMSMKDEFSSGILRYFPNRELCTIIFSLIHQ
jgi:hypothetical protein